MMSQDNRLLPLPSEPLDRPLRDLTTPVAVPAVSTEQPHLREYLAVVLKRKWLILSLVVIVTSLVTIQMYRMPSIYEASTQIQIEQKTKNPLTTGRGGVIEIRSADPNYWNTQLQKLKTQKLARQVILRLDLQNNPAFLGAAQNTGVVSALRRLVSRGKAQTQEQQQQQPNGGAVPVIDEAELSPEQLTPEQAKKLEPYEDALRDSLTVEPIERTNLVNIRFAHTDPQVASNVANTLATIFRENDIRAETSGSQKAEDVLANQIIELQSRIQANEQKRINYKQTHNIPLTDAPGANFVALRLSTYSTKLQQAEADRKEAESAYLAALETRKISGVWSIPQVISNDNIQKLRARISELEEKRAALRVNYTEEWPEVIKLKKQIEELKSQLDKAPEEVFIGLKTRYEATKKKEAELRTAYISERSQAAAQGIAVTGLTDLNQAIETDRQNLNLYQKRLNELLLTNGPL